jgi:osmotically-inducible protein OsmY
METAMIDTTLHHRVFSALEENVHLRGPKFFLEAEQGRVILRGKVRSYYQKQMAQEAIRHVDGVSEISNELEVLPV